MGRTKVYHDGLTRQQRYLQRNRAVIREVRNAINRHKAHELKIARAKALLEANGYSIKRDKKNTQG